MNSTSRIVTFVPLGRAASARDDETILDVARRAAVPLGNSCGGIGICTSCKVRVVQGAENLTEPTAREIRVGTARGFMPGERMACQAVVKSDCSVTTTYW